MFLRPPPSRAATRRAALSFGLALAVLALTEPQPVFAQAAYPTKPIRVVIPFGPGGIADISLRIVAEKMAERLGQQIIVENQPGAGGVTAARSALSAPPDGYTLALLTNGTAISVPLFKNLRFDPVADFAPISSNAYFDFVFVTNAASAYRSIGDVLAAAKAKPGALNIGTINVGSSQNLSAELFRSSAGIEATIVPYRSTPELLVALLRGDVDLMIDNYAAVKSALDDNRARAIATSGATRSLVLPNVPTVQEAGIPGFEVTSWNALFAPAKTPPEVIAKLNATLVEILAAPDVKKRLLDVGVEARASTPEEIRARLVADIEKWGGVIRRAGIEQQ